MKNNANPIATIIGTVLGLCVRGLFFVASVYWSIVVLNYFAFSVTL